MSMFSIGRKGYKWLLRNMFVTVVFALLYFIADEVTTNNANIEIGTINQTAGTFSANTTGGVSEDTVIALAIALG